MLLAAAAALAALAVVPARAAAPTGPFVVAIGDSLAAGDQPNAAGDDRPTPAGYANVLARRLSRVWPGLSAVKLSCGGATTSSIMNTSNCRGRQGSQLAQAESFLGEHRGQVKLVTIDVGDNDVERCVHAVNQTIDNGCLSRGRSTISTNLPKIVAAIQKAAGPNVAVVGVVDYDQYLATWLDGHPGRVFAVRTVPVIDSLNALMASVYGQAGVPVADGGARFATTDLRSRRRLPGAGSVPNAVYRVCRWTWACSGPPINFDDHANAAGYGQLAQAVLDALSGGARSSSRR